MQLRVNRHKQTLVLNDDESQAARASVLRTSFEMTLS